MLEEILGHEELVLLLSLREEERSVPCQGWNVDNQESEARVVEVRRVLPTGKRALNNISC